LPQSWGKRKTREQEQDEGNEGVERGWKVSKKFMSKATVLEAESSSCKSSQEEEVDKEMDRLEEEETPCS
jgi:hypothetical protein